MHLSLGSVTAGGEDSIDLLNDWELPFNIIFL